MKLVLFVNGKKKTEMNLEQNVSDNYKIVQTVKHGIELLKQQNNLNGHDWEIFLYAKSKLK